MVAPVPDRTRRSRGITGGATCRQREWSGVPVVATMGPSGWRPAGASSQAGHRAGSAKPQSRSTSAPAKWMLRSAHAHHGDGGVTLLQHATATVAWTGRSSVGEISSRTALPRVLSKAALQGEIGISTSTCVMCRPSGTSAAAVGPRGSGIASAKRRTIVPRGTRRRSS